MVRRKRDKSLFKKQMMVWLLVGVMVLSVFGIIMGDMAVTETYEYNGQEFAYGQQGFITEINEKSVSFSNLPEHVEELVIPAEAVSVFRGASVIGVTYDPDSRFTEEMAGAQFRLEQYLPVLKNVYVQIGIVGEGGERLGNMSCEDATADLPVLLFTQGQNASFTFENNCLIATAEIGYDITPLQERFFFMITEIMD